jgi:hypothetical protein
MKNQLVLLVLIVTFLACTDKRKTTESQSKTIVKNPASCYSYIKNNDEVLLELIIKDDTVSGNLLYKYADKDKNSGTITGEMHGDTLFANYTFMSEGLSSVREVVFLKIGNNWREGFGEVEEQNGKMVFVNSNNLKFDSKRLLIKISCGDK